MHLVLVWVLVWVSVRFSQGATWESELVWVSVLEPPLVFESAWELVWVSELV